MTSTALQTPVHSTSRKPLRLGLVVSAVVHLGIAASVVFWSTRPREQRPPVYKVELVGAPAGPVQAGVVKETPAPATKAPEPAPAGAEQVARAEKTLPTTKKAVKAPPPPKKATPSPTRSKKTGSAKPAPATAKAAAPPVAGSGEKGGKGTDVANIRTEGIAFPNQGYLNNIMRQVRLNWFPGKRSATLVAEVKFTIHRDGSVTGIEIVKSSRDRLYDSEALGAVEVVGNRRLFGELPKDWTDDVLVVYFTFDYEMLR